MEDCGSKRVGGLRTVFYPLSRQKSPTVKREKNACQLGTGCASLIQPLKISAVLHASLMPIIFMQLCRNSAAFNTFPLCMLGPTMMMMMMMLALMMMAMLTRTSGDALCLQYRILIAELLWLITLMGKFKTWSSSEPRLYRKQCPHHTTSCFQLH